MTAPMHRQVRRRLLPLAMCLATACSQPGRERAECQIVERSIALPDGLDESSGVAVSRAHPGVIWTHNDSGGEPEVTAVLADGERVGRVRIAGVEARDWEDLALAPCGGRDCLYVADTGDGDGKMPQVAIHRAPEPDPAKDAEVQGETFPMRYPGGPRDTEAMFVLPSGELYLVTKGRQGAVEIYRYPLPLRGGETVELEWVRTLSLERQPLDHQVTGASVNPSGTHVALRTYRALQVWRTEALLGDGTLPDLAVDLAPVGETQGEAVALLDNGTVVLTSEGGFPKAPGTLSVLRCESLVQKN